MCILKAAGTIDDNANLDREAFLLEDMADRARLLEEEYAGVRTDGALLNYQLSFPRLVESFKEEESGLVASVIAFNCVDDISHLMPIGRIRTKDRVRIDPRTSAWMMGKLLKLLIFAHDHKVAVTRLTGDNILIERDEHYVVVFDWTQAVNYPGGVPLEVVGEDIKRSACEVILALGGDVLTGKLPDDEQLPDTRYQDFLFKLASGDVADAVSAHRDFYSLVWELWPRKYHPYTTYPL